MLRYWTPVPSRESADSHTKDEDILDAVPAHGDGAETGTAVDGVNCCKDHVALLLRRVEDSKPTLSISPS